MWRYNLAADLVRLPLREWLRLDSLHRVALWRYKRRSCRKLQPPKHGMFWAFTSAMRLTGLPPSVPRRSRCAHGSRAGYEQCGLILAARLDTAIDITLADLRVEPIYRTDEEAEDFFHAPKMPMSEPDATARDPSQSTMNGEEASAAGAPIGSCRPSSGFADRCLPCGHR